MSDYTGPGIYEIVPYHAQEMSLNAWGADKNPGTEVKLYKRTAKGQSQWEIVAAGGTNGWPQIGDREYHILNVLSGLYLARNKPNEKVTLDIRSPKDDSVRWKIKYAGNGAYYINEPHGKQQINVRGSGKEEGTEVIMYNLAEASNCQFLLKEV